MALTHAHCWKYQIVHFHLCLFVLVCVLFSGFEANIFVLVLQFHALQSNYIENNTWRKRRYAPQDFKTSATAVTCAHNQCCVTISPMEILLLQSFLVNRTCRLIRELTQIKWLTALMTEICGWNLRTNCKTFEEICPNSHTGQEKSKTASRSKI